MCADTYKRFEKLKLTEMQLRYFDYPRPDPDGKEGNVKLYGDHYRFREGYCKQCDNPFDITYTTKQRCDYHPKASSKYRGKQQPHGCCGQKFGSTGCRSTPNHLHKGNMYLDLSGYRRTVAGTSPTENGNYTVYALNTDSVHTKKGLEVCKVSVINTKMEVVYNEYCLPTSEIIDYNTIWSGIEEKDLKDVTKTFDELRDDLLKLFSKETILVGHGFSCHLVSLKILHDNVVDTVVLYPHPSGLPYKKSLKDVAMDVLNKSIQRGADDSCQEVAKAAMQLALRKCLQNID